MRFWLHLLRTHWREALDALRTRPGRASLLEILNELGWPLLGPVAAFYRRRVARRVRIVAVVGSMGKTTTARATLAALGLPDRPAIEHNAQASVALALLRIRPHQKRNVLEIGIHHAGQMAEYADVVRPDVAVVTAIGSEHHTSLGTLETTRSEKAKIVETLPPGGLAVLNGDDPNVLWMMGRTRARVVTFGFGEGCDVRASGVQMDWPRGTRFTLHAGGREREVRTRLFGRHMVYPILAAAAVAQAEGVDLDAALARLERLRPTRARLQPVRLPSGAVVLRDDWKSVMETTEAFLDVLAEVPAGRRIVVLGMVTELARRTGTIYQGVGERLARSASLVIFFGKGTFFRSLRVGAMRGGLPAEAVVHAGWSVCRAIEAIPKDLGPGDVVLLKGSHSQRLERIAAALQGRQVRCDRPHCFAHGIVCGDCPELSREWI